jgi:hypothetical protein
MAGGTCLNHSKTSLDLATSNLRFGPSSSTCVCVATSISTCQCKGQRKQIQANGIKKQLSITAKI